MDEATSDQDATRNTEKVIIYIGTRESYDDFEELRPGSLGEVLSRITTENEYSFAGPGEFSHGYCLEAMTGRRPHETFIEVRKLLKSLSRIPFVEFLDLGHLRKGSVEEIEASRRWTPLAVFVLYCSDAEYERCVSEVGEDWRIRLSRFFRFGKSNLPPSPTHLRKLLDLATTTAIEKVRNASIYSAFISYSHSDQKFAHWLHDTLQDSGIRCWLDEKQLRAGDRISSKVESAIQERDKVLLCASKASLTSWWVDNEINSVIAKEQGLWRKAGEERLVLIPLNLDGYLFSDAWKSGWKNQITSRVAPDFTSWTPERPWDCNHALTNLIRALIIDQTTAKNPFSEV